MSEEKKTDTNELSEENLEQASGGGGPIPTESISLNYAKVERTFSTSNVFPKIDKTFEK